VLFYGCSRSTDSARQFREKTRLQNLVRQNSGRYYARLHLDGKEIWKSLKTSHFSVAEARLANLQKEHRERRSTQVDPANRIRKSARVEMNVNWDNDNSKRLVYPLGDTTALLGAI
jgi:hypothetical protein